MDIPDCQGPTQTRAALYVDGFNLYHPIKELGVGENFLLWSSLRRLGEMLAVEAGCDKLVKVVFCTAVPKHLPDSRDRHNTFNAAQLADGVIVIKGHHVPEDGGRYSEKQSDIHVALSVILDGLDDVYDVAILLSADSDQVATARHFNDRLRPLGKKLVGAVPLERSYPSDYGALGVEVITVTKIMLETCVMPAQVKGLRNPINRPDAYAPPAGWVHPDQRPKHKAPKGPKKWGKAFKIQR